ncbi:hypothetical protein DEH18_28815 [Streptomyces sp. NHF165]|uniref:Uncharacterized protein n=1 Tax=Streptomyces cacaoi TaxID=1898 RepID=A0A4Y3R3D9_STRCI|nr:hypothetical protein DEH18_28815 [Streptomyces sp. NHF165]GEB52141.1 hypothetical protein SCA03_46920 [Streptomyces cacaoi]
MTALRATAPCPGELPPPARFFAAARFDGPRGVKNLRSARPAARTPAPRTGDPRPCAARAPQPRAPEGEA